MEIGMTTYADEYLSNKIPRKYRIDDLKNILTTGEIEVNIKRGMSAPFSEIVKIYPHEAKKLLENNANNRVVNQQLIRTIANDILADRWKLNGETIIISKEGELNDGQHRLLAVVLANKPIETLVFFGAERESRTTVDMGKPRSVSNLLSMENVPNPNNAAAIARVYYLYRENKYQDNGYNLAVTKQELRHEYFNYQDTIDNAIKACAYHKFTKIVGVTPMCVSYIVLGNVNIEARDDFFQKLIFGENMKSGNPILKAREHLIDLKSKRMTSQQRMEAIFRYWNMWRRGVTVNRSVSIQNEWPEIAI